MMYLYWIVTLIGAVTVSFGAVCLISGLSGKADPTDHGNIVVTQIGMLGLLAAAFIFFVAWAIKSAFLG